MRGMLDVVIPVNEENCPCHPLPAVVDGLCLRTTVLVRSETMVAGTPPKWSKARRWQSQKRHQVLAADEAAGGVPAVTQRHVEAPHVGGAVSSVDEALVAPVHLGRGCPGSRGS